MKKKQPETSLSAYHSLNSEMIDNHFGKILRSLKKLKTANYTTISQYSGLEPVQCNRRLSEMVKAKLIERTDIKTPTPTGRNAYNYKLLKN